MAFISALHQAQRRSSCVSGMDISLTGRAAYCSARVAFGFLADRLCAFTCVFCGSSARPLGVSFFRSAVFSLEIPKNCRRNSASVSSRFAFRDCSSSTSFRRSAIAASFSAIRLSCSSIYAFCCSSIACWSLCCSRNSSRFICLPPSGFSAPIIKQNWRPGKTGRDSRLAF